MRIKLTLLALFVFLSSVSLAQFTSFKDRIVFGGNFGAGFSNIETIVGVSPTIGYRFTERFTAGPGFIYQYYQYKPLKIETNNYGVKVFGSYQVNDFLIAYSEYEVLNLEYFTFDLYGNLLDRERRNVGTWLVGGGYRQMIGSKSSIDLMLLYNLNETRYSPYGNPIIRIGFGIGL
jgi:hypothetical protein